MKRPNSELHIWSVTWTRKIDGFDHEHRKWFGTEREAQSFAAASKKRVGPHHHIVNGEAGLLSFAHTYC